MFTLGVSVVAYGQCLTDFTKLVPEPSLNQTQSFGNSISMYDDLLVIGVPNNDSLGRIAGIVRIYQRVNEHWKQIASLAPSDARDAMQFGLSVKISQDYILVGAGGYPRKVYLFKKPPGGWVSQTELTSFTVPNAVLFGLGAIGSIAISEDQQTIAITDPYYEIQDAPYNSFGAVFVFHKQPADEWSGAIVPVMIYAPEPDVVDFARGGVVIHGDRVITSAPYTGSGPGAIFIFRDPVGDFANPVLEATLTSGSSTETFFLGYKNVALNDDGIFASAVINTSSDEGKVSVLFYEKPTSGVWADALPTCTIHSYGDALLSGFVNLSANADGIYASHLSEDGSGTFTLLKKGPAGWCDPEAELIDEFTPDPAQLIFSYGMVSTASQVSHAAVGFVPHPDNDQAQLSLKVFSKEPDGAWSSQLIYPKEKSTSGHRYGNDILGFEDYLFVGAPYDGTIKRNGGAVYAYKKNGTAWEETGKILMPLKGRYDDVFGTALATDGTQLAVGATGFEEHGRVFIYKKRSADWSDTELVQEIELPEDMLTVFSYGDNLAMNRDWLLIPYVQNNPARIMMAIYKYNGSMWEYFQVVEIGSANILDKFTTLSVDIEGETAIAGSLIIERNQTTGLWEPRYRLSPSDPEPMRISPDFTHWITNGAMFGHQVDISNNTIFISAPTKDHDTVWDVGAVYVYTKKPWESWSSRTETAKILPRIKEERELFGYSLKALGNTLIVGAPGADYTKDGAARNKPGRAYVFQSKDYFWQDVGPLIDFTGDSFVKDYFGMAVNLDESDFFIGAPIEDIATGKISGSVYVTPTPPILMLVPPVCSNLNTVDLLGYPFGGTWSGPGIVDAGEGIFDPAVSGVGEHEFTYVTPSCTYAGKLKIRVEAPVEAKLNVEPEKLVCENSSVINVPVSVRAEENYLYQWYFREGSTDPFFPLNEKEASMNATQRGEYMARVYNEVCQSFSPVVTIRNESVDLTLAPIGKICQDDASGVELTGSPDGGTWSGAGVSGNRFYSKGLPDLTYTLKYKFTSSNNCIYEEPMQVVVERMEVPAINRGSGNLCSDGTVKINSASAFDADVNYAWEWKDAGAIDFVPIDEGGTSTTVSARGSARLMADNGKCVTRSNVITIDDSTFKVNVMPAEQELKTCNGDPVTLSVQHAGMQTYQWFYQETSEATSQLLDDQRTNSLTAATSGYYYAIIHSGLCEVTIPRKSVTVTPEESIFVPNVFTPNGDGFNDAFQIESNAGPINFRITNRHGKLIYTGNSSSGWTGDGVSSGIYYWYIDHNTCEGTPRTLKGTVHLMR